jgi:hypothetical protein
MSWYVLVFHGRGAIGYAATVTDVDARALVAGAAGSGLVQLTPVPEQSHAAPILSDDGTYVIPFDAATHIAFVSQERLGTLPLDLGLE